MTYKMFDERLCLDRVGVSVCLEDKDHPLPHKRYNTRGKLTITWHDEVEQEEDDN